ncbi:MAG: Bax inhibitor-1/YccA family protein [Alphaproteobacteria bacterium]|nr:MAG: Bax inhibitor-1/YccA family protein [Alphaproteobacteria bacterium]
MAQYETVRRRAGVRAAEIDAGLRAHMNRVYGLMSVAMLITGLIAWVVGSDFHAAVNGQPTMVLSPAVLETMFTSPVRYIIMFAPLAVVFLFGAAVNRLSTQAATGVFYLFAALMGLSISWIFAVFTGASIATTFFVTAIAFAGLSLYGYTTKRDLSAMGRFMVMGLIGLIVAMVINIFVGSTALQFAISVIGVLIFAGLTAWDTQSIKNEYLSVREAPDGEVIAQKMAIHGALRLYLDFLNLFLFLLQFLGNRQ